MRACGRAPSYSGKLIARAIELYQKGVKPGTIRWHELQATLQREFPKEFPPNADDLPTPETVLGWVKKYGDLHDRLGKLGIGYGTAMECEPEPAVQATLPSARIVPGSALSPTMVEAARAGLALVGLCTALGVLLSLRRW